MFPIFNQKPGDVLYYSSIIFNYNTKIKQQKFSIEE